jgi:hypothetical protein
MNSGEAIGCEISGRVQEKIPHADIRRETKMQPTIFTLQFMIFQRSKACLKGAFQKDAGACSLVFSVL